MDARSRDPGQIANHRRWTSFLALFNVGACFGFVVWDSFGTYPLLNTAGRNKDSDELNLA